MKISPARRIETETSRERSDLGFVLLRLVVRWGSGEPGFPLLSDRFCSPLFSTCAGLVGGWLAACYSIIVAFYDCGVRPSAGGRARVVNAVLGTWLFHLPCGMPCHRLLASDCHPKWAYMLVLFEVELLFGYLVYPKKNLCLSLGDVYSFIIGTAI
jgi:hypothetical protein